MDEREMVEMVERIDCNERERGFSELLMWTICGPAISETERSIANAELERRGLRTRLTAFDPNPFG